MCGFAGTALDIDGIGTLPAFQHGWGKRNKQKRPLGVSARQRPNVPNTVSKHCWICGWKNQCVTFKRKESSTRSETAQQPQLHSAMEDGDAKEGERERVIVCTRWKNKPNGWGEVPDEKDFEGGDVLRWDGIAVFPKASKLAKLVSELPWGAAATQQEETTRTMKCGNNNN